MNVLGAAARTAIITKRGGGSGGSSGALPAEASETGGSAGAKDTAEASEKEAALDAAARSGTRRPATAALTVLDNENSEISEQKAGIATAIAALPVDSSEKRPVDRDGRSTPTASIGGGPPGDTDNNSSNGRSSANVDDASRTEPQPPKVTAEVGEDADKPPTSPLQSESERDFRRPNDGGNAEETCAATQKEFEQQEPQQEGPSKPVALAAVAPLNEQMRGIGVRIARPEG